MKYLLLIFIAVIFCFTNCTKPAHLFLNKHPEQIIALQPLDDFSKQDTDSIIDALHHFFNKQVILLQRVNIPADYINGATQLYNADSILHFLSKLRNDSLTEIVGITHQPLFTIKDDRLMPYFDEHILGLGYQPGNACVISDLRFKTTNASVYYRRMCNGILHEIGHNLGLAHCGNDKCIMSKNNGDTFTLDNSSNDYCGDCRKKLQ